MMSWNLELNENNNNHDKCNYIVKISYKATGRKTQSSRIEDF